MERYTALISAEGTAATGRGTLKAFGTAGDLEFETVTKKLFEEIAPKYEGRQGGFTRIYRVGPRRGDAAEMAIIELI